MTQAMGLSLGSLAVVMATLVHYFSKIAPGKITASIGGLVLKLAVGLSLAAAAVVGGVKSGGLSVAVVAPAAVATMFTAMFLFLLSLRKTPVGAIEVAVGDRLLPFESITAEGSPFHSESLAGKRVLLKFFRGGW